MTRLVRAELLKLRTTQVWFWLLVADVGIGALVAIASLASSGTVRSAADVPDIFANSNGALITAFVLGILGVTTEFRYQTITSTVLATPSRWAIVWAKMIAFALVGLVYAIACLAVQLAVALPWLSAKGIAFDLGDGALRRALFGLLVVFVLFAVLGIGVGALLRNQIVAVTLGLVFLLVLQNLVAAIPGVRNAWPYTPDGAATSILFSEHRGPGDVHLLSAGEGVLVLLLWAVIPAVLGASVTLSRDIT